MLALVELNRLTLSTLDRWEREGIRFESHATGMLWWRATAAASPGS